MLFVVMNSVLSACIRNDKKWYKQSFKSEWLLDDDFKEWLREDLTEKGSSAFVL